MISGGVSERLRRDKGAFTRLPLTKMVTPNSDPHFHSLTTERMVSDVE